LRVELKAIADLLANRQLVQERLVGKEGERLRLVGAPLVGHETVVKIEPNCWRIVLGVSFLGASREVEVDEGMVERIV